MPGMRESGFQSPSFSSRNDTPPSVASRLGGERRRLYAEFAESTEDTEKKQKIELASGMVRAKSDRQEDCPTSFTGGGEGFVGGAKQWGGFVEDNGDGNIAKEAFELPFVLESVKENAVFHFFENFNGDAAGNVEASERKDLQREISGF